MTLDFWNLVFKIQNIIFKEKLKMKFYKIVYTCPVHGTFKDRQDGHLVDYSGFRVCCEVWETGANVPQGLKIYKLPNDVDANKLPRNKPVELAIDKYDRITLWKLAELPPTA